MMINREHLDELKVMWGSNDRDRMGYWIAYTLSLDVGDVDEFKELFWSDQYFAKRLMRPQVIAKINRHALKLAMKSEASRRIWTELLYDAFAERRYGYRGKESRRKAFRSIFIAVKRDAPEFVEAVERLFEDNPELNQEKNKFLKKLKMELSIGQELIII
jgi:hypothetical protein